MQFKEHFLLYVGHAETLLTFYFPPLPFLISLVSSPSLTLSLIVTVCFPLCSQSPPEAAETKFNIYTPPNCTEEAQKKNQQNINFSEYNKNKSYCLKNFKNLPHPQPELRLYHKKSCDFNFDSINQLIKGE